MSKIRQILRLYAQGESKRKISEMTGTARNTLKKYILQFIEMRLTMDAINEMDDQALDLFFGAAPEPPVSARYEKLHALLPAYEKLIKRKGVTVTMLWEQYREACPDGYALTQFFRHWSVYTGRDKPVMHIEHKAGDKTYIDFAGHKLSITDAQTGEIKAVEVFAAILGCSQLMYAEGVLSQKKEDLLQHSCAACQGLPSKG